jgi:hypothetical protein
LDDVDEICEIEVDGACGTEILESKDYEACAIDRREVPSLRDPTASQERS